MELEIIKDEGDTYNLPEAVSVKKMPLAKVNRFYEELRSIDVDPIEGFEGMNLTEKRAAIIALLNEPEEGAAANGADLPNAMDETAAEPAHDPETGEIVEVGETAEVPAPEAEAPDPEATPTKPAKAPKKAAEKVKVTKPDQTKVEQAVEVMKAKDAQPVTKATINKTMALTTAMKQTEALLTGENPVENYSKYVDGLNDLDTAEGVMANLIEIRASNAFAIGGMVAKLQSDAAYWGKKAGSFKEFIDQTFSIKYNQANEYSIIYKKLVEFDVAWEEFGGIGWSKVRVLLDVLGEMDLAEWVAKAKAMTVNQLKFEVANFKHSQAGEKVAPPKSAVVTKAFKLHADQAELVATAIKKAKAETPTDHESVALENICHSYISDPNNKKQKPMVVTADHFPDALKALRETSTDGMEFLSKAFTLIQEIVQDELGEINVSVGSDEE